MVSNFIDYFVFQLPSIQLLSIQLKEFNQFCAMKTQQLDQTIDQTVFSISQSIPKTCSSTNPATHVCCSKNCHKIAFICGDKSCECYKEHSKCPQLLIQSITNTLKSKIIPFQHLQSSILNQIDQTIDSLSKFKEQLQNKIQHDLALYGLTSKDKQLLSAIDSQKITGKSIIQLFHNAIFQDNKFVEKQPLDHTFLELWKPIDTKIKLKTTEFHRILESIKDNPANSEIKLFKNTKIQMSEQDEINLIKMFGEKKPQSAILLYRASQHNFQVDKFHEKCDNTFHTLTLCETTHEKVIGGYTPLIWDAQKDDEQIKDDSGSSFIFSLSNNHKFTLDKEKNAISQGKDYGPSFGYTQDNGCDLIICDFADQNQWSFVWPNECYYNQNYSTDDLDSMMKITGNHDTPPYLFLTKEWQVWQLSFE